MIARLQSVLESAELRQDESGEGVDGDVGQAEVAEES